MPKFNVRIHRVMLIDFGTIEAETPEQAAAIASNKCWDNEEISDAQEDDLQAVVDFENDPGFEKSLLMDFKQYQPFKNQQTGV